MSTDAEMRRDATQSKLLAKHSEWLTHWLLNSAYPLWAIRGVDACGEFVECLSEQGWPLEHDRRARVTPRQIFAFACAAELGWHDNVERLIRRSLDAFQARYRRVDGLYRTLVAADGTVKEDNALLYDQTFVLLALAAATRVLPPTVQLQRYAVELRTVIEKTYRLPDGGFRSGNPTYELREANPHMHLLEACLAWLEISSDPAWQHWADNIVALTLQRFIDRHSGALVEALTDAWQPLPDVGKRRVEPGHLFEWAWLLLRWCAGRRSDAYHAALRLIEVGEQFGVRAGFAVNALRDDLTMHDAAARLWPQTERIKANVLAAQITDDARYLSNAASAAAAVAGYLNTRVAGLWFDQRHADGSWVIEPSPASSFYHIVSAVQALHRLQPPGDPHSEE